MKEERKAGDLPKLTDQELVQVLKTIDWSKLTEWEVSFVKNVTAYWGQFGRVSEKQRRRLAEVWRRLHSPL